LQPKRYGFNHPVFFVCLNLDDLPRLNHQIAWFGVNRPSVYCFDERDHLGCERGTLQQNLLKSAQEAGYTPLPDGKIFFIGQIRFLGYVFNPVSFFVFCDAEATPQFILAQVENTFYERKLYAIAKSGKDTFEAVLPKLFYVSPYSDLDNAFHFDLHFSPNGLDFKIDTEHLDTTNSGCEKILISRMHGDSEALAPKSLQQLTREFPFLTWQIIGLIHWHALRLFQLGLRVRRKEETPHLQQAIIAPSPTKSL
jgi:DUF1365 family protein